MNRDFDQDEFEKQVRNALRPKAAPPNFESRVLQARASALASREERRVRWRLIPGWAVAVMAAIVLVSGATWMRQREIHQRMAGEAAKSRLELALRVASVKLQKIQKQVEAVE